MNLEISLQELAQIQNEILSKQSSFTLEKARAQVERLKNQNSTLKRMRQNA
jgi:hypothetical protein